MPFCVHLICTGQPINRHHPVTKEPIAMSPHTPCEDAIQFATEALAQEMMDGTGAYTGYPALDTRAYEIREA